jgi:hypothetical protein
MDWRHWLAGGALLALLGLAAWWVTSTASTQPTAAAPRGVTPRMRDAPETPARPVAQ